MTSVPSTAHITVYHVEEARLGFGTSHKLNMLTGMSSKQDLSRGLYGISGFLIKSPGVVCCKHPRCSWNEDLCSAGPVIERVRELCTRLWIQGSKSKTWFRHCIGRENNFQVWKAAAEGGYPLLVKKNRLGRHYLHLINQKWHQSELVLQTINETHNNETNHIIDHNEVIQCNEYWYQVSELWALGIQFQIHSSERGSSVSRKKKQEAVECSIAHTDHIHTLH